MPRLLLAGLVLLAPTLATAAVPRRPFGVHSHAYAAGAIVPDHVDQATLDQAVRDFYDAWKQRYLAQGCGPGRYYVATAVDSSNLTVSEGHGYGMVLAALMAGHDPDARTIFDGMYQYFRDHPTATHPNLMSWYQRKSDCASVKGNDSASDGDLDVAYALLLADKQWGSCGAIDYLAEAKKVIGDVKDGDVDQTTHWVLLGDWVTPDDPGYYASTRTSDFMPNHYRSFWVATGDPAWTTLAGATYDLVEGMQASFAPSTGLLPDFVVDPGGGPAPAPPNFLEGNHDGDYGYNACRTPWRLGTDFLISGAPRARAAAQRLTVWIRSATGGDPSAIRAGYRLDGTPLPGSNYLSMAFVAPLGVGAMVDASNQAWLDAIWDLVVATPITAEGYYENTLKLLAMVAMSGNWWSPLTPFGGGCDPPPPCMP
jgi:endo-1,4-beta-D-glucanase Y